MKERPQPSLFVLFQIHHLQAMLHLGLVPNPATGQPNPVDLSQAQYELDLLCILSEKTEGNRTDKESEILGELIDSLQKSIDAAREA